jgi:hypothetical protein
VKRKQLEREGGPKAMEPGKGGAARPTEAASPAGGGGGGGALGQRLVGEWKTGGGVTASEVLTFTADGGLTSVAGGGAPTQMRWVAAGPPQGETLTIKTGPGDPAAGEQRTIVFEDENQFSMTDSAGNRRFARVGSASAAGGGSPDQAPDPTMSKMVGTWENAKGLSYNFRPDGSYTVADAPTGRSTTGKWRVTASADGDKPAAIELIQPSGKVVPQSWRLSGDNANEIVRTSPAPDTPFKRKS